MPFRARPLTAVEALPSVPPPWIRGVMRRGGGGVPYVPHHPHHPSHPPRRSRSGASLGVRQSVRQDAVGAPANSGAVSSQSNNSSSSHRMADTSSSGRHSGAATHTARRRRTRHTATATAAGWSGDHMRAAVVLPSVRWWWRGQASPAVGAIAQHAKALAVSPAAVAGSSITW